jgi:hypothetical protein
MHGVAEKKTFLNTAFPEAIPHLWSNIDKFPPVAGLEPEFFSKTFHRGLNPSGMNWNRSVKYIVPA